MDEQQLDFSWIVRPNAHQDISVAQQLFPVAIARTARAFHRQIPGYNQTRLVSLSNLAHMLGLGGIYVKDESQRLTLNSFKVLGGSFALFRLIQKKLGVSDEKMTFDYLTSEEAKAKAGDITFAAATDGNHGRGVAWAASKLGYKCVIYVHSGTSQPRIDAIRQYGAIVRVISGNYAGYDFVYEAESGAAPTPAPTPTPEPTPEPGSGNTASVTESFTIYACLLVAVFLRLKNYFFSPHHCSEFTDCKYEISISLTLIFLLFILLGYTWSDKYGYCIRIF